MDPETESGAPSGAEGFVAKVGGIDFRSAIWLTTGWRPALDCSLLSLALQSVAVKRGSARAFAV